MERPGEGWVAVRLGEARLEGALRPGGSGLRVALRATLVGVTLRLGAAD